eukprot:gene6815-7920_t
MTFGLDYSEGTPTTTTPSPLPTTPLTSTGPLGGSTKGTGTTPSATPTASAPNLSTGGSASKSLINQQSPMIIGRELLQVVSTVQPLTSIAPSSVATGGGPVIPTIDTLGFPHLVNLTITKSPVNSQALILNMVSSLGQLTTLIIRHPMPPLQEIPSSFPNGLPSLSFIDFTNCGFTGNLSDAFFQSSFITVKLLGNPLNYNLGITSRASILGFYWYFIATTPNQLPISSKYYETYSPNDVASNVALSIEPNVIASSNLTSIELDTVVNSRASNDILSSTFPDSLGTFKSINCGLQSLPININKLDNLILDNNSITTTLSTVNYSTLKTFSASSNSLTGEITADYCQIQKLNLINNTQITQANECFLCYPEVTRDWLPPLLFPTSQSPCNLQISSVPKVTDAGAIVTIQGQNMGWGHFLSPNLKVITPNIKFSYLIPPKSDGKTSTVLAFSQSLSKSLSWSYVVSFDAQVDKVQATISGEILEYPVITFAGIPCVIPEGQYSVATTVCDLPKTFAEGAIGGLVATPTTGTTEFNTVYARTFPVVTAVDPISANGGTVVLHGRFTGGSSQPIVNSGANRRSLLTVNFFPTAVVTVGSQDCTNATIIDANTLTCTVGPTKAGPSDLTVQVDGYLYKSSSLLYFGLFDTPTTCTPACGEQGTCVEGQCHCNPGFSGSQCLDSPPPASALVSQHEESKPASSFSFEGIDFGFHIASIDEISFDGETESIFKPSNWTRVTTMTGTLTKLDYNTTLNDNTTITTTIEFDSQPRVVSFAGVNSTLEANALKLSLNVTGWRFLKSLNTLRVVIASTVAVSPSTNVCGESSAESQEDQVNNLKYLELKRNGVVFSGRFINRALSDGRVAYSSTTLLNQTLDESTNTMTTYVGVQLQHCQECILDPDFSLLVRPSEKTTDCSSKSTKSWVIAVAVAVPVIVVAFIVTFSATSPQIIGTLPVGLCQVNKISLSSTGVTGANECFHCYPEVTASWLPAGVINIGAPLTCNIDTGIPLEGIKVKEGGQFITLTGKNMGWGKDIGSSTSSLTMITPNTNFKFLVPPKSSGFTNATLNFSDANSQTIKWIYATPSVQSASFDPQSTAIVVTLRGDFQETPTVTVNGLDCTIDIPSSTKNIIVCSVPKTMAEGPLIVTATTVAFGDTSFSTVYTRNFPVVTSVDSVPFAGGNVTLHGKFSNEGTQAHVDESVYPGRRSLLAVAITNTVVTVTIGGKDCAYPVIVNSSTLTCIIGPGPIGPAELVVNINDYIFNSSSIFYYGLFDTPTECVAECSENGHCVDGECRCKPGFAGIQCLDTYPTETVTPNHKEIKPSSSFDFEGIEMGFYIASVDELTVSGEPDRIFIPTTWVRETADISSTRSQLTYTTTFNNTAKITTIVDIDTQSRVVSFAGANHTLDQNSLKVSINITGWPFLRSINTLRVVIASSVIAKTSSVCGESAGAALEDQVNNLKYLELKRNGVVFTCRFLNRALSDGRVAYSPTNFINKTIDESSDTMTTFVGIHLPHCQECILDPGMFNHFLI